MNSASRVLQVVLILSCFVSLSFAQEINNKKESKVKEKSGAIKDVNAPQAGGDKIIFRDGTTPLLDIENLDEAGALILYDATVTGGGTGKYLQNNGGNLLWGGQQLGLASGGVSKIDDLSDARYYSRSLFLGDQAGSSNSGLYNTGIGDKALLKNEGIFNVAVGIEALENNVSGGYNTAIGSQTLRNNLANYNTAIGNYALNSNTTGEYNVAIGVDALKLNNGSNNVAIGRNALQQLNSGSGNIAIGHEAGKQETGSNKLYIENSDISTPLIYGEFDNDLLRINGKFQTKSTGEIIKMESSTDNGWLSIHNDVGSGSQYLGYLGAYNGTNDIDIGTSGAGANLNLVTGGATPRVIVTSAGDLQVLNTLEVSSSGIQFNDGDTEDDNIIKKTTKMKYYINASGGTFPSSSGTNTGTLIGEIKLFPYISVVPGGWLECNGQLVDISTYSALFSLIGIEYGGDGTSTFALPDMRNAVPNHN